MAGPNRHTRALLLVCAISFAFYLLTSHAVRGFLEAGATVWLKVVAILPGT